MLRDWRYRTECYGTAGSASEPAPIPDLEPQSGSTFPNPALRCSALRVIILTFPNPSAPLIAATQLVRQAVAQRHRSHVRYVLPDLWPGRVDRKVSLGGVRLSVGVRGQAQVWVSG